MSCCWKFGFCGRRRSEAARSKMRSDVSEGGSFAYGTCSVSERTPIIRPPRIFIDPASSYENIVATVNTFIRQNKCIDLEAFLSLDEITPMARQLIGSTLRTHSWVHRSLDRYQAI